MTTVTLTDDAITTLTVKNTLVAVHDPAGRVVGFFAPVAIEHAEGYAQAAAEAYPRRNLPRDDANAPRYTTAEVLKHLESLEPK